MPTEISIPDKPNFRNIKNQLSYLQDVAMSSSYTPAQAHLEILETTIRIWRELKVIEKRYDEQVKGN